MAITLRDPEDRDTPAQYQGCEIGLALVLGRAMVDCSLSAMQGLMLSVKWLPLVVKKTAKKALHAIEKSSAMMMGSLVKVVTDKDHYLV